MKNPSKSFISIGCLFILAAVALKVIALSNPLALRIAKPSSFLILANTSFILAILLKK